MASFITYFDSSSGTVTKLNSAYSEEMIFPKEYQGITIKIIGTGACFEGKVTKVDMASTEITLIKNNAFGKCFKLCEITFPSSLHEIEGNSFAHAGLKKISIGPNVEVMCGYAWNQIATIESFEVDPKNPYFSSEQGYLFNKEKTKLIRAPTKVISEKDIPNIAQITTIGKFAFTTTNLKRFKCTQKLNLLEEYAFHAMYKITEIDLSLGTLSVIPQKSFYGCTATKISLPNTIKTIKTNAFYSSYFKMLIIWKNAETIEENAFNTCSNLKEIYYAGSFDQSNVACIASDVQAKVHVTNSYLFPTFCHFKVSRGWNGKMLSTIICNSTRSAILKLFFYVLLCSSR